MYYLSAYLIIFSYSRSLAAGVSFFESRTPIDESFLILEGLRDTPAITRGPKREPRPASSTPQMSTDVFENLQVLNRFSGSFFNLLYTAKTLQLLIFFKDFS